jgi:DNA-binding MarR family transcriptional regulator
MKTIEDAIKQKKFKTNRHKAFVNILYTSSFLSAGTFRVLKPFGISEQQYNILRILKGQHPTPATIKSLTERMLDHMSNASRLVDKLLVKGMVNRVVCPSDRRQVNIGITNKGLEVLEASSLAMDKGVNPIDNLTEEEAEKLSYLLDKIRQ